MKEDCAECGKPLPKRGGYSHMGESPQCARCFHRRWPGQPLQLLSARQSKKKKYDPGERIFLNLRVEQFSELWARFLASYGDNKLTYAVRQVLYGLPIEALKY